MTGIEYMWFIIGLLEKIRCAIHLSVMRNYLILFGTTMLEKCVIHLFVHELADVYSYYIA
jgi:hypothetical protein